MSSPIPSRSANRHMLVGSAWALLMRWVVRGIGLISVLILARLLTPHDFGIVAMGSLLLGLIEVFAELGAPFLLLRQREVTPEHCNTAWTIRLLQSIVVAAILTMSAPLAARYFSEPRLVEIVYVVALTAVIHGAENVGMVLVRKDLDFAKDFRFVVYSKIASFVVTLSLAWTLRSYWALVLGQAAGAVCALVLSYAMHSYRPRISLARWRDYLSFSMSVILSNIAKYLRNKADVLIVGGVAGSVQLGAYNVASELASMSAREITTPIWRGLFPTFARLKNEQQEFSLAFRRLLGVLVTICLPTGIGVAVVAEDAVAVLLGDQWSMAVPVLRWLAVYATVMALMEALSNNILFVTGHERRAVRLMWLHIAVMFPACLAAGKLWGLEAIAMAAAASAIVVLPAAVRATCHLLSITFAQIVSATWRPALAVCAMAAAVLAVRYLGPASALVRLILEVSAGALVYGGTLAILWLLTGRPDGPESLLWTTVRSRYRKF